VGLLRLAVAGVGALFIVLPAAVVERQVVPNPLADALEQPTAYLLITVLTSAATALLGALCMAFCAIYDARLFVRLRAHGCGRSSRY
jgi:hypothetical protein